MRGDRNAKTVHKKLCAPGTHHKQQTTRGPRTRRGSTVQVAPSTPPKHSRALQSTTVRRGRTRCGKYFLECSQLQGVLIYCLLMVFHDALWTPRKSPLDYPAAGRFPLGTVVVRDLPVDARGRFLHVLHLAARNQLPHAGELRQQNRAHHTTGRRMDKEQEATAACSTVHVGRFRFSTFSVVPSEF